MDYSPIIVSLKTASISIVFTFILGVLASWLVISQRNEKIKIILDGIFTIPLVLPPTVAGFFLLYIFGVTRPIGKFFIDIFAYKIVFSWSATVIAAIVMSFPLMYRSSRGAFEQVDENLIHAARTLGLNEWQILTKVYLPNALPGIISGSILAFARGLGEFGATAMIAGNIAGKTRTLPMAVYTEVAAGNMASATEYVVVLVLIAFISIIAMNYITYKNQAKKGKFQ